MSLILQKIVKEFTTHDRKHMRAVDNITLNLQDGKFHTLLGPSGCGKTTLLRMIAGFEQPTSGDIIFAGKRLNELPPQERGFSMVFRSYALFPHMNVIENISYGLKIKKLPKAEIVSRVEKAINMLSLHGQEEKHPNQMSGGQQQRVALARAMVMEPKIILFDEPLSNLDAKLRLHMRAQIRALQQRLGITAIYVTHDQEEAMAISDQIIVLNKGRVEQAGSPQEVYRKPATEFVANFIGGANIITTRALGRVKFSLLGEEYDFIEDHIPGHATGTGKAIIRPEAIHLDRENGRHSAKIENVTFLGSRINYVLSCHGVELHADVPWNGREEIFAAGTTVHFDIDSTSLHFVN
ncbi:MAG TPA: ABC transporter ATP-binding protein [Bdellovibrionales bacterium]|nr:ABC transporter ATP-binding protein [Bdellovibrionales bacterium]